MRSATLIQQEHKQACEAMDRIIEKGGGHVPLAEDTALYGRLAIVRYTLEWVHTQLFETPGAKGSERLEALYGYNHIANGPTHFVLYP